MYSLVISILNEKNKISELKESIDNFDIDSQAKIIRPQILITKHITDNIDNDILFNKLECCYDHVQKYKIKRSTHIFLVLLYMYEHNKVNYDIMEILLDKTKTINICNGYYELTLLDLANHFNDIKMIVKCLLYFYASC